MRAHRRPGGVHDEEIAGPQRQQSGRVLAQVSDRDMARPLTRMARVMCGQGLGP